MNHSLTYLQSDRHSQSNGAPRPHIPNYVLSAERRPFARPFITPAFNVRLITTVFDMLPVL